MLYQDGHCYIIFACHQYPNGFVYEFGSSGLSPLPSLSLLVLGAAIIH